MALTRHAARPRHHRLKLKVLTLADARSEDVCDCENHNAVIDGERIDGAGIPAQGSGTLLTMYLPEVTRDYAAPSHRYDCSGKLSSATQA
jgi:hypothetical protein